jgi:hypothetical protein
MRTTVLPPVPGVGDEVGQPELGAWWGAGGGNVKPELLGVRRAVCEPSVSWSFCRAEDTRA